MERPAPPAAIAQAKGPAGRVLRGIQHFHSRWEEVRPLRERFARALGLDWTTTKTGQNRPDDPEYFGYHAINWTFLYGQLLKAQAAGQPPVIKYPRDAGEGQSISGQPGEEPGDDQLASWAEVLITRMVHDADALNEWRDAIDDILAWGTGAVAIGIDRDVVSPELVQAVLRGVEEISASVLAGDLEAKPGERHREAASHLRGLVDMATEEDSDFELLPEQAQAYLARAQSHDAMALKEAKQPLPPAWSDQRLWARRLQVGVDLFWDMSVSRHKDQGWRARRIEMTLPQFKKSDLFSDEAKRRVKGQSLRGDTGLDSETAHDHERATEDDGADRVVILYEVWFIRPELKSGGIRRFVSPEVPGLFLERDSRNPYVDRDGRPLIPGFYPIFVAVPIMAPTTDPLRTVGVPAAAPGWPQQIEANELRTLSLASAKKSSKAVYIADRRLGTLAKIKRIIDAPDHSVFLAPPGILEANDRKNLIVTAQFTGKNEELDRQVVRVEEDFRKVMGIAAAVMWGQGVSDTLGQDQIAAQAGQSLQGLIIQSVEDAFARMCEGIRGLAKMLPIEQVVRYLGAQGAGAIQAWNATALDGDRMWVRFGSRASVEEQVDRKQLMETIALLEQKLEGGLPVFDTDQYYEDLTRSQGLGTPRRLDPQRLQLLQLAGIGMMLQEAMGPEAVRQVLEQAQSGGGGGGGGAPIRPSVNDPRGPSKQNIGAGASRGAATVNK